MDMIDLSLENGLVNELCYYVNNAYQSVIVFTVSNTKLLNCLHLEIFKLGDYFENVFCLFTYAVSFPPLKAICFAILSDVTSISAFRG